MSATTANAAEAATARVAVGRRAAMLRAVAGSPLGMTALITVAILVLLALIAPALWETRANARDISHALEGPSSAHPFGTDTLGRDMLARTLVGTRLSLLMALSASAIAAAAGLLIGVLVGLAHGWPRAVGQRVIDGLLAFPSILLAIFVSTIVGPETWGAVLAIGVAYTPVIARVAYTLSTGIAARDYIQAARAVGVARTRILTRYVLGNIAEPMIVTLSFVAGGCLVTVSALSFLGVGVQPPDIDWGRLLSEGLQTFYENPAAALAPALAIALAGLALGTAGEAIAAATNPLRWTGRGGARSSGHDVSALVTQREETGA